MRVRQSRGTSARRHGDGLPPRDQIGPGQLEGAGVELLRIGRAELPDGLEDA